MNFVDELIDFSLVVRQSSVKRFKLVPEGKENFRYKEGKMSISDLAQHLIDCDHDLFKRISEKIDVPAEGNAGAIHIESREQYEQLIQQLSDLGEERANFIRKLSEVQFEEKILDNRFGGMKSGLWIILRGNLDHEIHHRGQLSILLNLVSP